MGGRDEDVGMNRWDDTIASLYINISGVASTLEGCDGGWGRQPGTNSFYFFYAIYSSTSSITVLVSGLTDR